MDAEAASWLDAAIAYVRAYPHLTAWLALAFAFAGGLVVVSLFTPVAPFLVAAGSLQIAAGHSLWAVWLAATLGAFAGDLVSFGIGHRAKGGIRTLGPLARYPQALARTETFFARWGAWSIFGAKALAGVRSFVPVVAGMAAMPVALFVLASLASCIVYTGVLLLAGGAIAQLWG